MDSTTSKALFEIGRQVLDHAWKQSPSDGNGYGFVVVLLVLLCAGLGITLYRSIRSNEAYRKEQDAKRDADDLKREADAAKREADAIKLWKQAESAKETRAARLDERLTESNKEIAEFVERSVGGVRATIAAQEKEIVDHDYRLRRLEEKK